LRPTPRGIRLARDWPTPEGLVDALEVAFAHAADNAADPQHETRLRQAAQAVGSFGRDVAVDVLAKQLSGP
jgi:hypothetical protein